MKVVAVASIEDVYSDCAVSHFGLNSTTVWLSSLILKIPYHGMFSFFRFGGWIYFTRF